MKTLRRLRLFALLGVLLAVNASLAAPTQYQIAWYSIDSGGGSLQGGTYTLQSSIGQPDAATLSGGTYQLKAGFWHGSAQRLARAYIPALMRSEAPPPPPTATPPAPTATPPAPTATPPAPTATPPAPTATPPAPTVTPSPADFEAQVLVLVNQHRAQAGCAALTYDSRLRTAAFLHSQDMAFNDFMGHTGSNGSTVGQRVSAQGYSASLVGENVAAGYPNPAAAVNGWMNSPGHRANILNCNYTQTGIGYFYQSNDQGNVCIGSDCTNGPFYHYWTQVFARP